MFKTDYLGILRTQSTTGGCDAMLEEVNRQLDLIPNITRETDDYGNLYVTKGKSETYPAFVAHLDTVHKIRESFVVVETELNYWFSYSEDDGFQQVGIGGDDKCGIIACLELLTKLKIAKCVFFLDEEQGCKGSAAGKLEFFDDCRYAVQIDRKGGGDIIVKGSGTELCSKDFEELLETLGKKYEYKSTFGASTDVVKLKDRGLKISACNLSAGYYNPHTKQEYIDADELLNCIDFCAAIAKIKTVYPHSLPVSRPVTTSKTSTWSSPSTSDRKCVVCNEVLGYNFGILCNECIIKHLTLSVDENEVATITQESLGICVGCSEGLYTEEELSIAFCYVCQFCSECGLSLQTEDAMKWGYCDRCFVGSEFDDYHTCQSTYCSNMLSTRDEKLTGYCKQCVVWDKTTLHCIVSSCGKELETESEIDSAMCTACIIKYS